MKSNIITFHSILPSFLNFSLSFVFSIRLRALCFSFNSESLRLLNLAAFACFKTLDSFIFLEKRRRSEVLVSLSFLLTSIIIVSD